MVWLVLLHAAGVIPWIVAWRANRGTTLRHVLAWAGLAWIGWGRAVVTAETLAIYAALTLTGCAGVAVLGARRPGAAAWHFVIIGLLAVLWIPWAEGRITGAELKLDKLRLVFLACLVATTVINYYSTNLTLAAGLISVAIVISFRELMMPEAVSWFETPIAIGCIELAPFVGWVQLVLSSRAANELDRAWLAFRDRYGLVWGLRLMEQFNRASANAGWPIRLRWNGMRNFKTDDPRMAEFRAALIALTKRFGLDSRQSREPDTGE